MKRRSLRLLTIAVAAAGLSAGLAAPAPAHIDLRTCAGPYKSYNGHRHVTITEIDLVNTGVDCHFAGAVVRIYIEDYGHYHGWSCHARGVHGSHGHGRGNCKNGRQEMHFNWRIA